jgi:hypothetical protein
MTWPIVSVAEIQVSRHVGRTAAFLEPTDTRPHPEG